LRRRDFLAATGALALVAACADPEPDPPQGRRSGAYVGWPQTPATLDAFAQARGRPLEVVGEYLDGRDWDHLRNPTYLFETYAGSPYAADLVLSLPLITPDETLARAAAGYHVDYWAQLAEGLVEHGMGSIVVRPGWEANSPVNYPWSAVSDPAAFRGAFVRCVDELRSVAPELQVDLCVTAAADGHVIDVAELYPGDEYVDVLGVDLYDMWSGAGTDADRWDWYRTTAGGLDDLAGFAAEHGKPLAVDEWAVASPSWGGGGDNPQFVRDLVAWMDSVPVRHEIYNEVRYDFSDGRLFTGGVNPRTAQTYSELIGRA
jgi:hypothetical protein